MSTSWWRRLVPWMVSAGLLALVFWQVSASEVAAAAAALDWPRLLPTTAALVLALYLWDSACLRWLFAQPSHRLRYGAAVHARGTSYLASAVNYEVGQGVMAWLMARAQGGSVAGAVSRCVLLAYHDVAVLLTIGLTGSIIGIGDRRLDGIMVFCLVGLGVVALLALAVRAAPSGWLARWRQTHWGDWVGWWTWRRSLRLCLLRVGYFGISVCYAAVALSICAIPMDHAVVCSTIPIVLLVDGLPISVSGIGTREQALLLLLRPQRPDVLVAFSMVWSTGLIIGRVTIGLVHLWAPRLRGWLWQRGSQPVT